MKIMASSQRQFDTYLRQTMGGGIRTPMDWANEMMRAFTPSTGHASENGDHFDGQVNEPQAETSPETIDDFRRQLAELTRAIRDMQKEKPE